MPARLMMPLQPLQRCRLMSCGLYGPHSPRSSTCPLDLGTRLTPAASGMC